MQPAAFISAGASAKMAARANNNLAERRSNNECSSARYEESTTEDGSNENFVRDQVSAAAAAAAGSSHGSNENSVRDQVSATAAAAGKYTHRFLQKWSERFDKLKEFKRQHGHSRVSANYEEDGIKLGRWVERQRVDYKKCRQGKPSNITQERIDQLNSIEFEWSLRETSWNQHFEALQSFKADKGHCRASQHYETSDGIKLGRWAHKQRTEYSKLQQGKSSSITQERINQLNSLGFEWNLPETSWNQHFDALQCFKAQKGHCRVPWQYKHHGGIKLGCWVHRQRKEYQKLQRGKSSAITQERIKKLSEIDFIWKVK